MNEYLEYQGILYRHLSNTEDAKSGEVMREYSAFYHKTGTKFYNRVAMLGTSDLCFFRLLNKWNSQPQSGWSYYA